MMATSFGALCSDFYINTKVSLKMDLPGDRETILHLLERIKKTEPGMDRFHRYESELVLESSRREVEYKWLSLRRTSIRAGHVNPQAMEDAYRFHKLIWGVSPYNLTISPLDIDYFEVMMGFDLECKSDHDEVVYEALFGNTGLANLLRTPDTRVLDVQPLFGLSLNKRGDLQAYFEVKTRTRNRRGRPSRYANEPLSLLLTVRKYGPIQKVEELEEQFDMLRSHAEALASERLVPDLLTPIARQITSSNA